MLAAGAGTALALGGCAGPLSLLPTSGPSAHQIAEAPSAGTAVRVVDVDGPTMRRLQELGRRRLFSEILPEVQRVPGMLGLGDVLEISVWEAQPATLFAVAVADPRVAAAPSRATVLLEQVVSADGSVNVPFAGPVQAAGKLPKDIEAEIVRRLRGKANQPQVVVRVTRNVSAAVAVMGDVAQSTLLPLSARGERLLDALAAAGGVRQPVSKVMLQLTRGDRVQSLPMDTVLQSPRENVTLAPGDVVTAQFQPMSFSVLGATGKNEEVNFEVQGISLAQALARSGGFQDARADARGVFIFRMEDAAALPDTEPQPTGAEGGKVPTIYRMDMKNPASFLLAQGFPIRNKDVLYVSNAPAAELQKFLNLIATVIFPFKLVN